MKIKNYAIIALAATMLVACANKEEQLHERAMELCQYIPDHELKEQSQDFMTQDFYNVLDTMFNHLPEHEAMDHEWLHYFVTGNGGTIADYEVVGLEQTDATHAIATINVRQKWEDGSFDETSDVEEHRLYMEKVDGKWLMSDFDEHKQDCIRHIEINHREQALRDAMSDYLVKEVGEHYLKGDMCIPSLMVVASEKANPTETRVWCDCWIWWYELSGDTLKTISGGNHSGCMTIEAKDGKPVVTAFEQTTDGASFTPSAKRIFGKHYDTFEQMHAADNVVEAVRKEQLGEYVQRHNIPVHYYQDYGWDAVEL